MKIFSGENCLAFTYDKSCSEIFSKMSSKIPCDGIIFSVKLQVSTVNKIQIYFLFSKFTFLNFGQLYLERALNHENWFSEKKFLCWRKITYKPVAYKKKACTSGIGQVYLIYPFILLVIFRVLYPLKIPGNQRSFQGL